ncbi:hypothetical protein IT568_09710 [bacterium]|nr:hypothetical protein [bacterium]
MLEMFLIIFFALGVFFFLASLMKPINNKNLAENELKLVECSVCHNDFDENILFFKNMGQFNHKFAFCENCMEELYLDYQNERIGRVGKRKILTENNL